jgi:hypothetical protein
MTACEQQKAFLPRQASKKPYNSEKHQDIFDDHQRTTTGKTKHRVIKREGLLLWELHHAKGGEGQNNNILEKS